MAEVTLKVPAEHVEAWRDAVLVEMRNDAKALADNVESAQRSILEDRVRIEDARVRKQETGPPQRPVLDDVLWPGKTLRQDFEILEESFVGTDGVDERPAEGELAAGPVSEPLKKRGGRESE